MQSLAPKWALYLVCYSKKIVNEFRYFFFFQTAIISIDHAWIINALTLYCKTKLSNDKKSRIFYIYKVLLFFNLQLEEKEKLIKILKEQKITLNKSERLQLEKKHEQERMVEINDN